MRAKLAVSKCGPSWHHCAFVVPNEAASKIAYLRKYDIYEYAMSSLSNIWIAHPLKNMLKPQKNKHFWIHTQYIHLVTLLIKCVKGFFEMEGARYLRLTYFLLKRNIILGAWAQMWLRMYWGGVLTSPRLCEQGNSLLCVDVTSVCLVCLFPNELSCSDIEFHKMFTVSQSALLVVAFIMNSGLLHIQYFCMF